MRFELNGLRELLEVQLGSLAWTQLQGSKPQQANLWRRLQRIGLSGPAPTSQAVRRPSTPSSRIASPQLPSRRAASKRATAAAGA